MWFEISFPTSVPTNYPTRKSAKITSTPTNTISPTSQPSTAYNGVTYNNIISLLPKVPKSFISFISISSDLSHQNYKSGSSEFSKFRSSLIFPKPVEFIKIVIDVNIYKFGKPIYYNRTICSDKDLSNKIGLSLEKNYEFDLICDGNRWQFQPQYKYHNISSNETLSSIDLANVLCINCKPSMLCLVSSSTTFVIGTDDLCFEHHNKTKANHRQRLFSISTNLQEYNAIRVASNFQLEIKTFTPKTIPEIANIAAQASNTSIHLVIFRICLYLKI
jgi:hypothetical protein